MVSLWNVNVNIFKMFMYIDYWEIQDSHFHDIKVFVMLGSNYSKKSTFHLVYFLGGRVFFLHMFSIYTYTYT